MSTPYFAHHAYGVMLDEKEERDLRDRVERALSLFVDAVDTGTADDTPEITVADAIQWLEENELKFMATLRAKIGSPADAKFIYTGAEDAHPGESGTPADSFILGYGVMVFPRPIDDKFAERAEWYGWVTAAY